MALSATPPFKLPIMHIHLGHPVYFILRTLVGTFNPKANSLNECGEGREKMICFKVADQGVGLHCTIAFFRGFTHREKTLVTRSVILWIDSPYILHLLNLPLILHHDFVVYELLYINKASPRLQSHF